MTPYKYAVPDIRKALRAMIDGMDWLKQDVQNRYDACCHGKARKKVKWRYREPVDPKKTIGATLRVRVPKRYQIRVDPQ